MNSQRSAESDESEIFHEKFKNLLKTTEITELFFLSLISLIAQIEIERERINSFTWLIRRSAHKGTIS